MIRNLFDQKEITEKKNWKFDYLLKRKNGNFCLMFSRSKFKERSEARGWMAGQIWRNRLQFWREKIIKIMDLMLLLGTANSQFCGPGKFELWRLLQRQFRAIKCHAKKLVRTKRCGVGFIFQKQKSPTYGLCKNLLVEPLQNRGKQILELDLWFGFDRAQRFSFVCSYGPMFAWYLTIALKNRQIWRDHWRYWWA